MTLARTGVPSSEVGEAAPQGSRNIDGIPVRNIWLLLLYASELFRGMSAARRAATEENPDDIPDLVAEVLAGAVNRRLRRNLNHGFQRTNADLNRVRGRIDLLRSERRGLLQRGKIACSFEELTIDTPRNRFVKMALLEISKVVGRSDLARRCRDAAARLEQAGVTVDPSFDHRKARTEIIRARWGRIDADDRQMLAAAYLAFNLALPTEETGDAHLSHLIRDSGWARRLFEKAVGGFYKVALTGEGWKVTTGERIYWQVASPTQGLQDILPSMQTDIVLEHVDRARPGQSRRIVIDTKFTSLIHKGWQRDRTLSRDYIYQIYAYLRSQEGGGDPLSLHSTGVLLHPSVGEDVDEAAVIQGHQVRFVTVDLTAESKAIRDRLLRIAQESPLGVS